VNVTAGTLTLGSADRLANGATVTVSGGTLAMGANADSITTFNMSSGAITGSGPLTATTYGLSGGTVTGNLGTGTLNSSGTVALNGISAATAVNVTAGTLTLGSADRLANGATVTVSGGTLAMGGNNDTVSSVVLTDGSITGSGGILTGTSTHDVRKGNVSARLGGSVGLTKTTADTVTLTGANTFTGTTTVSAGTLEAGAAGALGSTTNLNLTGGTLLLSNTGTTDRLNDSATVTLAGGTIAFSGNVSEGSSPGVGVLTLTADSVIDFAGGNALINFAASNLASWTGGAFLDIYNWGGLTAGGGNDQLKFGIDNTALTSGQLGQVRFYDGGFGSNFLGAGTFVGSLGEVVPVPEPSSLFVGLALFGLAGWREQRQARRGNGARRLFTIPTAR